MRDRLIELIESARYWGANTSEEIADHLLANGAMLVDTENVDLVTNQEPIRTALGMPLDELADLIRAKQEGRIIVPPCEVGQTVYILTTDIPTGIEETKISQIVVRVKGNCKMSYCILAPCVYDDWGKAKWSFCDNDFGKTVFLTKEQAEKALKGGAE